jgi:hypothetical protein
MSVRRLVLILLLCLIPGVFIVRTARLDRSAPADSVGAQYALDKIEVDDRIVRLGRVDRSWSRIERSQGTLEAALKRYGEAAHIPIAVRWEALAAGGIRRDTPLNRDWTRLQSVRLEIDWIVYSVLGEGAEVTWRCRHRTVEVSTFADFDADVVRRRYPVADLIAATPAAIPADPFGLLRDTSANANPGRDEEFVLQALKEGLHDPWFAWTHQPPFTIRIDHGTLEVVTTLEKQVTVYEALRSLRVAWKSTGWLR